MLRALVHIGLSLAIVLAPALCCCKTGWFTPTAAGGHACAVARTAGPNESNELCCHLVKKTCCGTASHEHPSNTPEMPGPAHAPECACCLERPDAAPPEGTVTESTPKPTGELLALALAMSDLLGAPVHTSSPRLALAPGSGVDARYSALFERHVLRC